MKIIGFDWDEGNSQKCQSHGVSLREIEQAFEGEPTFREDEKHSENEDRFFVVNILTSGRYVFVAFTFRFTLKGLLIRPFSARFMHAKEIRRYENTATK